MILETAIRTLEDEIERTKEQLRQSKVSQKLYCKRLLRPPAETPYLALAIGSVGSGISGSSKFKADQAALATEEDILRFHQWAAWNCADETYPPSVLNNAAVLADLRNPLLATIDVFGTINVSGSSGGIEVVLDEIRKLFRRCEEVGASPMIYYTGYGDEGTGDWCFPDGKLSFEKLISLHLSDKVLYIYSDTCFSGHWCRKPPLVNVKVFSASAAEKNAVEANFSKAFFEGDVDAYRALLAQGCTAD